MPKLDPRVGAYIEKSAAFAKPILNHIRKTVHAANPNVEETLKWGFPHFMHQGILCSMAAFKHYCAFNFWKHDLILPKSSRDEGRAFGKIITIADLPSEGTLVKYIREAVRLNGAGIKVPTQHRKRKPPLAVPPDLQAALKKSKKAQERFEQFSPSHKREYVEWIAEAKREETRKNRLDAAIEWMEQGKSRNWKYQK